MKRLFEVNGSFFESKQEAKAARGKQVKPARTEKVNGRDVSLPPEYEFIVRLGPDHFRFGTAKKGTPPTALSRKKRRRVQDDE